MKILISGSSGLIGQALIKFLTSKGHTVQGLRREKTAENSPYWNPKKGEINLAGFNKVDAVINLAGENISQGRWTEAKKKSIRNSRVQGTKLLADFFSKTDYKPRIFISGSAIGFYGDRGSEILDEKSLSGNGFLADVCKEWEEASAVAGNAGIRVVNIRTGMVLSSTGGALKKMLFPFKLGLGGIIGNGEQYMSWISINDVINSIHYLLENDFVIGPVNLVSPLPVTNFQYTKTLGKILHRPTLFPLPAFVAKLIFGEMAEELLLSSTRVLPQKLINSGYKFLHSDLEYTFKFILLKEIK